MANQTTDCLKAFKASIVRIYHSSGAVVGAGFLISNECVLTCAHVITQALGIAQNIQETPTEPINLDFPLIAPGEKLTANVVFWQPVSPTELVEDLAGLKLNSMLPDAAQPVRLVTADELWGHNLRVFGFPKGHNNGVWASGVLRDQLASGWVQMEDVKATGYRVEPGFSGAPVWDEQLAGVVGMAVAAERQREGVKAAFLIPIKIISQAWPDLAQWVAENHQLIPSTPATLPSFRQVKVKALQKSLEVLSAKYEAAYNQLNYTLSEVDRIALRGQIESLEREIVQVESELSKSLG